RRRPFAPRAASAPPASPTPPPATSPEPRPPPPRSPPGGRPRRRAGGGRRRNHSARTGSGPRPPSGAEAIPDPDWAPRPDRSRSDSEPPSRTSSARCPSAGYSRHTENGSARLSLITSGRQLPEKGCSLHCLLFPPGVQQFLSHDKRNVLLGPAKED